MAFLGMSPQAVWETEVTGTTVVRHTTVLVIFPLILQTITTAQMFSNGGEQRVLNYKDNKHLASTFIYQLQSLSAVTKRTCYPTMVLLVSLLKMNHPVSERFERGRSKTPPDMRYTTVEQRPSHVVQFTTHAHFSRQRLYTASFT